MHLCRSPFRPGCAIAPTNIRNFACRPFRSNRQRALRPFPWEWPIPLPLHKLCPPSPPRRDGPHGLECSSHRRGRARAGEAKMRVNQLSHWLYVRGARRFDAMTNVSKHLRAALSEQSYTLDASGDHRRADLGRWHAQMADAHACSAGPADTRRRDRDRLHPRGDARHAVRLLPGRLHAQLLLLPHRHAEAGAQPHCRPRSSAQLLVGARPPRRLAGPRRTAKEPSCRATAGASSPTS